MWPGPLSDKLCSATPHRFPRRLPTCHPRRIRRTRNGWRWRCSRWPSSSSSSTPRSSTSRCRRSAATSTSPRRTSPGWSTATRSSSAASCCSAAAWPTCSVVGACSSPASSLFALASLVGGLATSPGMLIAARAVQGLGAALLSPAALSLVTVMFAEGAERNKAMGVWGAVAGSGGAAGVLLGGVLTEYAGWEWVLFVNVPIGLAAAALAPRLLPESRTTGTPALRRRRRRLGDRRPLAARLHAGRRQRRRLDLGPDARPRRGRAGAARRVRGHRAPLEGAARPVLASSSGGRSPAPTSSRCWSRWRCSRCSSSSPSTCSWCSATTRSRPGLAYLPLAVGIIVSAGIASSLVTRSGFKPVLIAGLVLTAAGPGLVRAGLGRRRLRLRHPVPVAARGRRPGLRLRVDDDRRGERHVAAGGRPGVRADQHLAADRRRARASRSSPRSRTRRPTT